MRKTAFGWMLALTLLIASPAMASEEQPVLFFPSFDPVEWIFDLLEALTSEVLTSEIAPELEFEGVEVPSSINETGRLEEQEEASPPTPEMGPGLEPGG